MVTGARLSQIARLTVADLQDGAAPRLTMPSSRKGRGRRGRKPSKSPGPITREVADEFASNRPTDQPFSENPASDLYSIPTRRASLVSAEAGQA